jgi:DNA-directed RNA polymerase specialized sigma24 family protein
VSDGATDDAGQGELALGGAIYNDDALVRGVQRGDAAALREFCARFRPVLLEQARRFHIPPDDRDTMVLAFLDDLAMKIVHGTKPTALAGFVIRAFRNHAIDQYRRERVVQRELEEHAEMISGDRVVPYGCSSFTTDATQGTAGQLFADDVSSTTVYMLTEYLMRRRTPTERQLLMWLSNRVPLRDIAAWLQLSYSNTKVRAHRLRLKMAREAVAYLNTLDEPARSETRRFLHRAGVGLAEASAEGAML